MTIHKLPRQIRLGNNYIVKVKLVSPTAMKTVAPGGAELDGMWDDVNKIIYVDKTLSLDEQWETLRHELLHAIIDIDHEVRIVKLITLPAVVASVPSEVPVAS